MADRQTARELFLEGNRLFRIPLYTRAVETYLAALAKWKNPAFYFNLALAQSNLGQDVEARESLAHALAHGEDPLGVDRFKEAQRELEEVTRKLGRIRLTSRTPGAEITLDGVTLFIGSGSYEGWVKAKSHELTAKKVGYQSEARRVTLSPGQLMSIDLTLVTLTQALTQVTDTSRRWATWKPWVVAVGGLAAIAVGGTFHAISLQNYNEYSQEFEKLSCAAPQLQSPPGCSAMYVTEELRNRYEIGRRYQTTAFVTYAVGGALVVTSAILLYLNRPRMTEISSSRNLNKMHVRPAVSVNQPSLILGLSF
jgi:tetratricopeptide (TPR) repeat protein